MRILGKSAFALVALASVALMGLPSGSSLAAALPQAIRPLRPFAGSPHRGSLDPSFGNAGKVVTMNAGFSPCPLNAALQPSSKIVVMECAPNNDLQLVRYLSSGSLDPSFGKGGIGITGLNGDFPTAVTSQIDGKIVVAAHSNTGAILARFNSNGTLDPTFGRGGVSAVTPTNVFVGGTAIVELSDGRIVVDAFKGGFQVAEAFGLARFLPNGALDSTFGKNGLALINTNGFRQVSALAVALDGTFDALISQGSGLPPAYAVHFSANGGFIEAPPSGGLAVNASNPSTAFQPDAKIVFAQGAGRNSQQNGRLTRYNSIDPTFLTPAYSFGQQSGAGITLEPNGGILAGGQGDNEFALARFNLSGSVDTGFGSGGTVKTPFFTGAGASAGIGVLLLQSDGKIVAVGGTFNSSTGKSAIALARYFGP